MSEFLWHKVSEKEKEEISKKAKLIMDNFSKKLDFVKESMSENFIEGALLSVPLVAECHGKIFEREEGNCEGLDINRKVMFENAPQKNDSFIIAEKKKW
ncbi:hypothetical protein HN832_01090 [archaeon]|jgi:hypothetical protein|nr:hypothetical protein [archaeon]MBT4373807.1 hypothetical protein [archaeon]MBT4532273.1 hypothetical protein [archaeon]MBT7001098.1 hypothetical protein [archaeon]MBT7281987.1 hypothetical protein [archaeon]